MKILSIVWYKVLPPEYGGQKGVAIFNRYLSEVRSQRSQVSLICVCSGNNELSDGLPYKVLPVLPVGKFQFVSPSCIKKIKTIAEEEKPTHIIAEHPYHGLAAIRASKATGAKLIVHSHNIESQRFRKMGKWWWQLLHAYEKRVHRKADLSLFKTENDLEYAVRHFGIDSNKCLVVPYGIEGPATINKSKSRVLICRQHGIDAVEKILLFAGTLDYKPNADAVENIYKEIAPRLTAAKISFKIIICGRNRDSAFAYLKKLSHAAVINAGEIPNIADYFAAADVFIDPVQQSSGIQTKIIDALSYHCNVIAFKNITGRIPHAEKQQKVFSVNDGDWDLFANQVLPACETAGSCDPAFFDYYDERRIVETVIRKIEMSG